MNCPPCPKSYFQSFNDRVIAKCKEEKRQKMKSVAGNVYGRTVMGSVMSINPSVVPEKQITKKVNPVNSFQVPIYDAKLEKLFKKVPEIQQLASMINITHAEISQDIQTITRANQEGYTADQELVDRLLDRIQILEEMIADRQTLEMSAVKPVGDIEVVAERQFEEGRRMVEEVQTREKVSYEMGEYFGKAQSEEELEAMRLKQIAERLKFRNETEQQMKEVFLNKFITSPTNNKKMVMLTLKGGLEYAGKHLFEDPDESFKEDLKRVATEVEKEYTSINWKEGTQLERAERAKKFLLFAYDAYKNAGIDVNWKGLYESIQDLFTDKNEFANAKNYLKTYLHDPEVVYPQEEELEQEELQEALSELDEGEIQPAEVEVEG